MNRFSEGNPGGIAYLLGCFDMLTKRIQKYNCVLLIVRLFLNLNLST